jgi:hypothetical protein
MVTLVTRAGKGSPLTNAEMDANLINLNEGKQPAPITEQVLGNILTPHASVTNYLLSPTGNLLFNAPTGTPTNLQKLLLIIYASGAYTITFNAIYRGSPTLALPTVTSVNKTDYIGFMYNAGTESWHLAAYLSGLS